LQENGGCEDDERVRKMMNISKLGRKRILGIQLYNNAMLYLFYPHFPVLNPILCPSLRVSECLVWLVHFVEETTSVKEFDVYLFAVKI
jgi:hypothetical protein